MLVRCPGFALVALDLGERVPRLSTTLAFRLKFAVRRTDVALLIVGRRRLTGSSAALAIETLREGIEWAGPGPVPTRLARVRTTTRVLRSAVRRPAGRRRSGGAREPVRLRAGGAFRCRRRRAVRTRAPRVSTGNHQCERPDGE